MNAMDAWHLDGAGLISFTARQGQAGMHPKAS